ncbi:MAG: choice-of-anchor tandem repeat GloVer-containing protein [Terriglobales bacterium]
MNKLTRSGVRGSFKALLTLLLMMLAARFADARVGSSNGAAQQSGVLTYTGTVLHTFTNTPDGGVPNGGLVADSSGNLYGATTEGGTCGVGSGCGSVFELTPDANGGWTYKEIFSTYGGVAIAIDSQGNLYVSFDFVAGAVFELSQESGTWRMSYAYGFTGAADGSDPMAPVIVDANGNVYGTTLNNDQWGDGYGTVFELTPAYDNQWQEQTLFTFTDSGGAGGAYPEGSLIMDHAGNLYGTATGGGTYGHGVVFKLHPTANGWKETILYSFQGGANDGEFPYGNLIFDKEGNLYGTTAYGFGTDSARGYGGVYKLTPSGLITWLYVFTGGADGGNPGNGLAFDQLGNLYGTAGYGPPSQYTQYCPSGCGVVYELTPSRNNGTTTWTENVLYSFTGGSDGYGSSATPYLDPDGNIYVTSPNGGDSFGASGAGTVLELKPNPAPTAITITKNAPSPSVTEQVVNVRYAVSQLASVAYLPTGTVTVNASTGESCLAPLSASGKGSCQLMFLSAGTRTLTATYSGDAKDQSSVSGVATQTVVNLTNTVITKTIPDRARVGENVRVDFSVDANYPAKHTKPSGSVTVNASTGESCTGTVSHGGIGKCELTFSSAGTRTLTATYAGDDDNAGSLSKVVDETVK